MSYCNSKTKNDKPCKNGKNCHLHSDNIDTCSICLNQARKTRGVTSLLCGHTFHKKCIDLWKVKGGMTCPMCRKNIDETKFKVILTIENTQTHQINSTPLNINSILSAFGNINLDDPFFLTQMSMNIDSERDLEQLLRELNVELADIETLSFV